MRKSSAILAALFIFLFPLSASAHDEIQGSSPAAGETVTAGAFEVSVTFEEDILQSPENQGLVIEVLDPTGATVSNGCVTVNGATLATSIDVDTEGDYRVNWRSIGSDGHAVEGDFTFRVENSAGYQSSGIPAAPEGCAKSTVTSEPEDNTALIGLAVAIALVMVGSIAGALKFGRTEKPKG